MVSINNDLLYSSVVKERKPNGDILGKDDFLKILMTQLQNQDPLNPMEDKDFIAQMATFSNLEQMTNMANTMEKFVQTTEQNQLISYNQFVGKEVTWHRIQDGETPDSEPTFTEGTGLVKSVVFKNNTVEFLLEDGTKLEPGNISQVNHVHGGNESPLLQASYLIGKNVSYEKAGETISAMVSSVSRKDGQTWIHLNNDEKILSNQLTEIKG